MRRALAPAVAALLLVGGCSSEDAGGNGGELGATESSSSASGTGATSASVSRQPEPSDTAATQGPASEYQSYANPRFGFTCEVPGYFAADEGAVNGDGRGFTSPDLAVRVVCSGINNVEHQTAAEGFAAAQQSLVGEGATVTYKVIQGNTFTLSGLGADGNLYYQRTVWGSGSSNTLLWTYPPEQKADLDPAVVHSAESFKPGDLTSSH